MARIQALPGQYPGDVFIERTYIDFQSWTPERDQLGDNQKAQQELSKIDQRFEELKSLAGTKEDRMKEYSSRQVAYWELMARLAEAENHKLDAMAYYENALLTRLQAGIKPEPSEKDELAADAQKLWAALGGSADGWKTW